MAFKYKNSFFQMEHRPFGTWIKFYPPKDGGKPLTLEEVIWYFDSCDVGEFDRLELNRILAQLPTAKQPLSFQLSTEPQLPENEKIHVIIDAEKRKAIAYFYPPSNKGKLLNREEILEELKKSNIRHGIIEKNLDIYLKNHMFLTPVPIAMATPAREGVSAKIEYRFDTSTKAKPKINEDGSVDFHDLGNINHVNAGDVLAVKSPVRYGEDGMDVTGRPIKPAKVNDLLFKFGKHIHLSEDGRVMYSDVSGHVTLVEDTVFVSDTYEVAADVSASTGDIEYDGNVNVKGNVVTGFTVRAKGDIYVDGIVEGASLYADGNIVLKRGIQGGGRGYLEAKGDIISKFIENSTVVAAGNVSADAIMHSNVTTKANIRVTGKRGLVTGGELKCGGEIVLKTAGSAMGTMTLLEIGADPVFVERFHALDRENVMLLSENEKLEQIIAMFKRKLSKGEKIPNDKLVILQQASVKMGELQKKKEANDKEMENLREEIESHGNGRIVVENLMYPGTKLVIANLVHYIKTETHYCQFIKEGADIISKPIG